MSLSEALLLVPLWPLLLAWPRWRRRGVRWLLGFALLPAVLALPLVPQRLDMPWLLFGSGLALDGATWPGLLGAVLIWSLVLVAPVGGGGLREQYRGGLLLALAGHLWAVLATEPVAFFAASGICGYALCVLMMRGGHPLAVRAGRRFLGLFLIADLLLFEALLLAVGQVGSAELATGAGSAASVALLVAGLLLRSALWPLWLWVPDMLAASRPALRPVLIAVPIVLGMTGLWRWVPAGTGAGVAGIVLQGLGVVGVLHALLGAGVARRKGGLRRRALPLLTLLITGLMCALLGRGLADPARSLLPDGGGPWVVAAAGVLLAVLARWAGSVPEGRCRSASGWLQRFADGLAGCGERWQAAFRRRWQRLCGLFVARSVVMAALEQDLRRWQVAMILFVLVTTVLMLLLVAGSAAACQ